MHFFKLSTPEGRVTALSHPDDLIIPRDKREWFTENTISANRHKKIKIVIDLFDGFKNS